MAKILNSTKGSISNSQAANETFSLISNEKLLAIYAAMVKCRMLEQRATLLFQQGKLVSDLHASAWREASSAAVAIDLSKDDTLSVAPGDWLPAFLKGMSLEDVFRVLAPADSKRDIVEPHKNIVVPLNDASDAEIVRERASHALSQRKGNILVAFIAPEPPSLKPWLKVMASAAAKRLPIVFVHYIEQTSVSAGPDPKSRTGPPEAIIQGVPAIAVDALDPVAVYRVAYEAIIRARQARGATLLECTQHPIPSPDSTGTETRLDHEPIFQDPVAAMETYLKRKAIEPEPHNRQIAASFVRDLDLATRFLDR